MVRIALTIAALNDLDIMAVDIENAYLNALCREKALYGLKTSGAAWRAFLAQTMYDLQFKSCKADPDLWMKPEVKNDGTKLKEDPKTGKKYSEPKIYLGNDIGKFNFPEGGKPA
eukprot:8672428-Ditylum_brightwellii.AAC.1